LEPGSEDLNEALSSLLSGYPLKATSLKKMWKDALKVLGQTDSQTALADAVGLSLTPGMIFLMPEDSALLMVAARNYPQISTAIQTNFLSGWSDLWERLHAGGISVEKFNRLKDRFFVPLVSQILDLGADRIDSRWLKHILDRGLVADEDIEKRFPRFVLAYLERRDRASRIAQKSPEFESAFNAMAENLAVLWTLSSTHVPALLKWVKKYDQ
jgi:hypothetical protein